MSETTIKILCAAAFALVSVIIISRRMIAAKDTAHKKEFSLIKKECDHQEDTAFLYQYLWYKELEKEATSKYMRAVEEKNSQPTNYGYHPHISQWYMEGDEPDLDVYIEDLKLQEKYDYAQTKEEAIKILQKGVPDIIYQLVEYKFDTNRIGHGLPGKQEKQLNDLAKKYMIRLL